MQAKQTRRQEPTPVSFRTSFNHRSQPQITAKVTDSTTAVVQAWHPCYHTDSDMPPAAQQRTSRHHCKQSELSSWLVQHWQPRLCICAPCMANTVVGLHQSHEVNHRICLASQIDSRQLFQPACLHTVRAAGWLLNIAAQHCGSLPSKAADIAQDSALCRAACVLPYTNCAALL
jgi:hypothetical protein